MEGKERKEENKGRKGKKERKENKGRKGKKERKENKGRKGMKRRNSREEPVTIKPQDNIINIFCFLFQMLDNVCF